jgi:hypothetical protein
MMTPPPPSCRSGRLLGLAALLLAAAPWSNRRARPS